MLVRILGIAVACVLGSISAAKAEPFAITSTSFKDGQLLDRKHAGNLPNNPNCIGNNTSPAFQWSNVPDGTKSFAILMVDPEVRAPLGLVHWVAYGIPASTTGFAEGALGAASDKYVGGKSSLNAGTYIGPCTPPGVGYHHYVFTLIATDLEPTALQPGLTREELATALAGRVKGAAGIVALFGRP